MLPIVLHALRVPFLAMAVHGDDIRPEGLGGHGSSKPLPHVDPATFPPVTHGRGTPPPPPDAVAFPRRRSGPVVVDDGTPSLPPEAAFGGALGKEASSANMSFIDPCLGAAVLTRGCRPQRHTASPTLWLTGPAHQDLAKFAVGVVGVAVAGAGIWVYLGRAGVAAAAAAMAP